MVDDWARDVERLAKKAMASTDELMRAVQISLFSSVVDDTRVDTGRLKGNWAIQHGSWKRAALAPEDPGGDRVKREIEEGARTGTITYFTNSLPYAIVWEKEDGMVAKNLARLRKIVRDEAAKL